jgi:hypothetical protein
MKVVINTEYGGFGLSDEALEMYAKIKGLEPGSFYSYDIERDDPVLVQVVETLGDDRAGDRYAYLKVVEIPDGISWHIMEYDGIETIHEDHRSWD